MDMKLESVTFHDDYLRGLSLRQLELIDRAKTLAARFARRAASHDNDGSFPSENFIELKQEGFLDLTRPCEFGGQGADILDLCLMQYQLARGCASTALTVNMHLHELGAYGELLKGEARNHFFRLTAGRIVASTGSEPDASWTAPSTRAVRAPGGYVVTGRKNFLSGAPVADLLGFTACLDSHSPDCSGTCHFFVPRDLPGLRVVENWNTMGMRATGSHDLLLEDVFVESRFLVSAEGSAVERFKTVYHWFTLSVGAVYLGIAAAALELARDHMLKRFPQQTGQSPPPRPGAHQSIAEIRLQLDAASALLFQTAAAISSGYDLAGRYDARIAGAKTFATETAVSIVHRALRILGGQGYFKKNVIERLYRDVRAGEFHPYSPDVARQIIANHELKASS
jgi:alkylation response protein AidB-like acyl-CoA dehydrogenase